MSWQRLTWTRRQILGLVIALTLAYIPIVQHLVAMVHRHERPGLIGAVHKETPCKQLQGLKSRSFALALPPCGIRAVWPAYYWRPSTANCRASTSSERTTTLSVFTHEKFPSWNLITSVGKWRSPIQACAFRAFVYSTVIIPDGCDKYSHNQQARTLKRALPPLGLKPRGFQG